MNPKLHEAVALFKTLGWENVTPETVLQLPVGTAEEKRTALAGLKSGEWGEIAQLSKNTYGWRSYTDADQGKLALFAIRVGADARRAANIAYGTDTELLLAVIAERGPKYAADFISYACVSRRRMFEHSSSVFGIAAVQLVDRLHLEIPQNVEYMKDWAVYAAAAMGLKAELCHGERDLPDLSLIQKRFEEHITAGIAVNAPATGPFGAVLPDGVKRSWLSRERGLELVFAALDASVRPGDRKIWLDVLDELNISAEELCAHTEALIPLLATGDSAAITKLAPVLIAQSDDNSVSEVLLAAFSATTKKAKQLVLKSALARPYIENPEELAPWLGILGMDSDKTTASLAQQLMKRWELASEAPSPEKAEIQGLWQDTPPVWLVPGLEMGEASPEALTELAAELASRPAVHDITTELFLATANRVAYENPEAARTSLRGLRPGNNTLVDFIACWVKREASRYGFDRSAKDIQPLLTARDYVVSLHLEKLPCLLSTPSMVDLSIRLSDLASRIALYKESGTEVLEADLLLALTRLDITTQTPELVKVLPTLDVSIVLQSGKKMSITVGQAVLRYLDDPIPEPALSVNKYGHWSKNDILLPDSLNGFPHRFVRYAEERFSIFPLWGDAALGAVRWDSEVYHEKGLILRQVARRASPLPPGAAINFLAAQRSSTPAAAADSAQAVTEAWERGLLRPGIADISLLDWSSAPPSNLAALATALEGIIQDGLLSVVWPVLDALIAVSLKAPRLLAGTAELAELTAAFLPEVQNAVEKGAADATALHLPGIRALAKRSGSSRAVSVAREIAAQLPVVQDAPETEEEPAPIMDPPFEEVWPVRPPASPPIDDGVSITVDWANPEVPTKQFLFTLALPGIADRVFQIVNRGWYYDLETEGQCQAYIAAPDAVAFTDSRENQVWLHWNTKQKAMAVCPRRNWAEDKDGPLQNVAPPLPASLLTVVIGMLAQDGDAVYFAPHLLRKFIANGQIGEEMIRRATRTLLSNPVVSPAKLVRPLEKDIRLLPVLWPMLTESVTAAGKLVAAGNPPPVWVNRILDIALRYAPYLKEAATRGLIPPEDAKWPGLSAIASSKAKSTAVTKAKKLLNILTPA